MHVYAVHEVTTYLRELFESSPVLGDIWIAGEVSNVSRPASGHVYFTLKDGTSSLKSVFFATKLRYNARPSTAHLIENGNAIVAHGRISLYEQRGDLQVYVDFVQPEGAGELQLEYERLKARLEEEGLFDPGRKRPLPRFPHRIGVITSESGAVFHDICQVLDRRWPLAEVILAPTPVQGPDAVPGIVGAFEQLGRRDDLDVIIAGRGGGSIEELWAFNDEHVARAIFASRVPVVSAVGHETDVTIADFVADRRAPTPSAAAEIVSPDRLEIMSRLIVACATMDTTLRDQVRAGRARVERSRHSMDRAIPDVNRERQRIDDVSRKAQECVATAHRQVVQNVGGCVWRLKTLDPLKTLERGYAIVQRGRTVISTVAATKAGDALDVQVQDGTFAVRVGGAPLPQRRRAARKVLDAQAPLFTMPEERA